MERLYRIKIMSKCGALDQAKMREAESEIGRIIDYSSIVYKKNHIEISCIFSSSEEARTAESLLTKSTEYNFKLID